MGYTGSSAPLWVRKKRRQFEALQGEDPEKSRAHMDSLYDKKSDPFRDAVIGRIKVDGENAKVQVRNASTGTSFFLELEGEDWRIVEFGTGL